MKARGLLETLGITLAAIAASLIMFGVFMVVFAHVNPLDLYYWMYRGGFGSHSAWEDTLTRGLAVDPDGALYRPTGPVRHHHHWRRGRFGDWRLAPRLRRPCGCSRAGTRDLGCYGFGCDVARAAC